MEAIFSSYLPQSWLSSSPQKRLLDNAQSNAAETHCHPISMQWSVSQIAYVQALGLLLSVSQTCTFSLNSLPQVLLSSQIRRIDERLHYHSMLKLTKKNYTNTSRILPNQVIYRNSNNSLEQEDPNCFWKYY